MGEKFGARLRQQREAQRISLDAVARRTKIKFTLLDAMEHDDVSAWPRGLFRRAFVRAYAQAVGLEPEGAVREFLADFPDRIVRDPWTGANGGQPATVAQPVTRKEGHLTDEAALRLSADTSPDFVDPQVACADIVTAEVVTSREAGPAAGSPAGDPEPSIEVGAAPALDLDAVACLCTDLGRVERAEDVAPLLGDFGRIVEAKGVIVWVWDAPAEALRPAVVHGYPDHVLARLPAVTRDADNPTAETFRTGRPYTINGRDNAAAGLVVPLLAPAGCVGALGIEFERGVDPSRTINAVATIVAAFISQLVGGQSLSDSAAPRAASRESA